ncbi:MAG: cobalt-precorrin 5A hydrolase [Desulfamplus sp.]|nr:cobalt-precorrin 5A hydrolase [Desulfamplus sp.]
MIETKKISIWAITPGGLKIGEELLKSIPNSHFFISNKVSNLVDGSFAKTASLFDSLSAIFQQEFNNYDAHICIFSTGIAVRIAAPLIKSKLSDPAIVVIDDRAIHAISLVSGHLGGANRLTIEVAKITGAAPVITTATDINQLPSIDMVAKDEHLIIENPEMIKEINMAFLKKEPIIVIDPMNLITPHIPKELKLDKIQNSDRASVVCSDLNIYWSRVGGVSRETLTQNIWCCLEERTLILRPLSLVVGMGCNRGTTKDELAELLKCSFIEHNLSTNSIAAFATTSLKKDEHGLLELAKSFKKPIKFYDNDELNSVKTIKTPSKMVKKHIGVKSVCEAAAILASHNGKLIVPKIKQGNATLAVARIEPNFL